VSAEAWNQDLSGKLATGTLLAVDNQIDPATLTLKLKAKFDNATLSFIPTRHQHQAECWIR